MTNTKTKFVALALAVAMVPAMASAATVEELMAQINALMAQLQNKSTVSSCSFAFTKSLRQGMSDIEVMNLQKFLNRDLATVVSTGGFGSAGNETMYFGAATKSAVIRFQNKYASEVLYPVGLATGSGFVGDATRAKLNALCAAASVPVVTTPPPSTVILSGGAGSVTNSLYSSDTETDLVTGTTENILGFKIQADGSDVKVSHIRVRLTNTQVSATASNVITRYFNRFDVMMNGVKVGSMTADEFIRDSAGVYTKTIALDNAIVRSGTSNRATFYVRATPVDAIDTDNAGSGKSTWKIDLQETRYMDATGVTLSDSTLRSMSGINISKLSSSSDVKVKISTGAANPDEKVVFVSDSSSGDKITMLEFTLKAEGTAITFDQVKATGTATGTALTLAAQATEFDLMRGSEVLNTADASVFTGTGPKLVTFNLDNPVSIAIGDTATFKIVARMQKIGTATFAQGDTMKFDFASVNAQDRNGDNLSSSTYTGSANGRIQTFRSTGLNMTRVSTTVTVNSNNTTPSASFGEFKMQVKLTASGDDIWVPLTIASGSSIVGIDYSMLDGSGSVAAGVTTASITNTSGGVRDGAYVKIADGETATFEVVVTYDPTTSGQYRLQINKAGYTTAGAIGNATAQIVGTPTQDFQSSLGFIQS